MSFYLPSLIGPARNVGLQFEVFAADERWQRRRAARVPWDVYRADRRWTPPLRSQWSRALDPDHNPWLAGAEHALFLAEARNLSLGDVIAGRLAVWGGEAGGVAYFGAFEVINDPALTGALFSAAEMWLFEHVPGLAVVRGPFSLEPQRASGLLVDGFDARPAAFVPYNLPYYPELLMAVGFEPGQQWQAYALDLRAAAAAAAPENVHRHIRVVGVEGWPELAGTVLDLYCGREGKAAEPGGPYADLVPVELGPAGAGRAVLSLLAVGSDRRFSAEARLAANWLRRRLLVATAWEAGRVIGAVVGLPDNSTALRRANGRLLPLGWLPYLLAVRRTRQLHVLPAALAAGHGGQGMALELYAALAAAAVARGFATAIVGPIGAAASVQALTALNARVVQTYQLFEKQYNVGASFIF
ncbi:MAG: hypothetical protein ACUVSS_01720 [Anaerolineae bacterium]